MVKRVASATICAFKIHSSAIHQLYDFSQAT